MTLHGLKAKDARGRLGPPRMARPRISFPRALLVLGLLLLEAASVLPAGSISAATPYLWLEGGLPGSGPTFSLSGQRLSAFASGFCSSPSCSLVAIRVNDRTAARAPADANGNVSTQFIVSESTGNYRVSAVQTQADGTSLRASAPMTVPAADIDNEQQQADGSIRGVVQLQGRSKGNPAAVGNGIGLVSTDRGVTRTLQDGSFAFDGIPPGDVLVSAWAPGYLARTWEPAHMAQGTEVNLGELDLPGGDADGDNAITADDVKLITGSFGLTTETRKDANDNVVDINGDGIVDVLDTTITSSNIGLNGFDRNQVKALARVPTLTSAQSTQFSPNEVVLRQDGDTAAIEVQVLGLPRDAAGAQVLLIHSERVAVSSFLCDGPFAGGILLGPVDVDGGTLAGCILGSGPPSDESGPMLRFVVTRIQADDEDVAFGSTPPMMTSYSFEDTRIAPGELNMLRIESSDDEVS